MKEYPAIFSDQGKEINEQIEISAKYEGYIVRQQRDIKKLAELGNIFIPEAFCYRSIKSLGNEAKEKLSWFRPPDLATASRVEGVTFGDIAVLMVALERTL